MEYEDILNAVEIRKLKKYNSSEKLIDLHAHTIYSDGELTPNELINLAIEKGISTLGITDHDTVEGLKNIDKYNYLYKESGLKVLNGIELSADISKGRMHILGYDIDIYNKKLNKELLKLRDSSTNLVLALMEQIRRDYKIEFTYEEIKELINKEKCLRKSDLEKLCVIKGYAKNNREAFNKYLINASKKVDFKLAKLSHGDCIELIKYSGGIPVLAHPKTLGLKENEFLKMIENLINYGLQGIEVYNSIHTKEETEFYKEIANKYKLLISGGSDYHGKNTKPDIELGSGKRNNLKIKKLTILDKIKY